MNCAVIAGRAISVYDISKMAADIVVCTMVPSVSIMLVIATVTGVWPA
jgi:hypothetical protein